MKEVLEKEIIKEEEVMEEVKEENQNDTFDITQKNFLVYGDEIIGVIDGETEIIKNECVEVVQEEVKVITGTIVGEIPVEISFDKNMSDESINEIINHFDYDQVKESSKFIEVDSENIEVSEFIKNK